jgi:hypothetical protein
MSKDAWYAFMLLALLIGVTYFIGLATDINAFTAGAVKLAYAFSGRTPQGQPGGYPSGGPAQIQTF